MAHPIGTDVDIESQIKLNVQRFIKLILFINFILPYYLLILF